MLEEQKSITFKHATLCKSMALVWHEIFADFAKQVKCSVLSLIVCPSLDIQEEMHQEDGRRRVSLKACHNTVHPGMLP